MFVVWHLFKALAMLVVFSVFGDYTHRTDEKRVLRQETTMAWGVNTAVQQLHRFTRLFF